MRSEFRVEVIDLCLILHIFLLYFHIKITTVFIVLRENLMG
jgi:hypothetical protein